MKKTTLFLLLCLCTSISLVAMEKSNKELLNLKKETPQIVAIKQAVIAAKKTVAPAPVPVPNPTPAQTYGHDVNCDGHCWQCDNTYMRNQGWYDRK